MLNICVIPLFDFIFFDLTHLMRPVSPSKVQEQHFFFVIQHTCLKISVDTNILAPSLLFVVIVFHSCLDHFSCKLSKLLYLIVQVINYFICFVINSLFCKKTLFFFLHVSLFNTSQCSCIVYQHIHFSFHAQLHQCLHKI